MFTVGNVDRYIDRYIGRRSGRQSIDSRSTLGRLSIVLQRISSSDIRATQREKDQGVTENWCHVLLEEGYSSELASIDN
ncbi:hypothetical protein P5673_025304 [Acropora cervicornis]|uniref:Uncharacterized protein n=1 Tax=Acropora cervicornis TaxID=6130 RepID=A0AAD9Q2A1_ACRCE|nr:hypothetical protein P5673_025304 [Acropora cervicornis]